MAPVRIENEAFSDARVDLLGSLAGYNRYEALGRLAHLWRVCTQKQTHIVSEAIVNACIGPAGAQHLVDAELGERVDGGIRVRGTSGRIEWLGDLREKRVAAGKARMQGAKRDSNGQLLSSTPAPEPACAGPAPSTGTSTPPAQSSALTLTITKEENSTLSGKPDLASRLASVGVAEINRISRSRFEPDSDSVKRLSKALARAKYTEADVLAVVQSKAKWAGDPTQSEYFRPSTLLALANFEKYLDELAAKRGGGSRGAESVDIDPSTGRRREPDVETSHFVLRVAP